MVKRHYSHVFPLAIGRVVDAWTDEGFLTRMMAASGSRAIAVSVERAPGERRVTIEREVPTDAPPLIRSVVGAWTSIRQVEHWSGRRGGPWQALLEVDPVGKPAKGGATLTLARAGKGCRCEVELWARCTVPLVSLVVETLMIEDSLRMIAAECRYIEANA